MSNEYGIEIGDANYGTGGNNWRVMGKGVDNIYRILPPLGAMAVEGKWQCGHAGHWGYENSEKKLRLFKCIEVRNPETKMAVQICPECSEHIAVLKTEMAKKYKAAVEFLINDKKFSETQADAHAKEKLKGYEEQLRRYNRSFRIYVNAINEKEEIGVLNMAYKHLQLLKAEMAELRKGGIDPLGVRQGAWFNFKYSTGQDHSIKAVYVGNALEGQRLKPAALTEAVLKRLKNEACLNLASAWDAARLRELNEDQIRKLVQSKGDPTVVDAMFSRGDRQASAAKGVDMQTDLGSIEIPGMEDAPVQKPQAVVSKPQVVTQVTTQVSAAPLSPPDVNIGDDEFNDLFAKM